MGMGSGGKRRKAGSAGTGWQDSVHVQQCKGQVCVCVQHDWFVFRGVCRDARHAAHAVVATPWEERHPGWAQRRHRADAEAVTFDSGRNS